MYNYKMGINWIKSMAKKPVLNNKNLMSLFAYEETSLWWWMESWLYSSFVYCDSFEEIIKQFYIVYHIIKEEKPDKIIFVNQGLLVDKLIILIAKKFNIKTEEYLLFFKSIQFSIVKKLKLKLIKNYFKFRFFIRKVIWNFLVIYHNKKDKIIKSKNSLLFIYFTNERNKLYVEPILKEFKEDGELIYSVDVSGTNPDIFNIKRLNEKILEKDVNHLLLENFVSASDLIKIHKGYNQFKSLWSYLKKNKAFIQAFNLKGINMWNLFQPQFSAYFDVRLKSHLMEFVAVDNAVKLILPRVAVSQVETSSIDKCVFVACRKRRIPTVAVQHGTFFQDIQLIHEKGELSLNEIKPNYCPTPDVTAVYGKLDKDFLIEEGNYPMKSVVVSGNPRYDPLVDIKKRLNKEDICSELKIDTNKKIFLFAAQPFSNMKDKEILFYTICKTFTQFRDLQLVVKVHPGEEKEFYEKIIKQYKINAKVTDMDVFKTLFICDVLLVMESAVALEAAILNKPIIMINLVTEIGYADYARQGIALPVYKPEDLASAIKKILSNKSLLRKLEKNRGKYIYNHCYKIDGKSSQRIVSLIKRIMGARR